MRNQLIVLLVCGLAFPAFADIQEDLQRAVTAYSNGQTREALNAVDSILRKNPWYRDALLWKGICFETLGDDEHAQDVWLEALRQDPAYLPVLHRFGSLHLRRNENDKALDVYRRILAREPLDLEARLGMGEAYLKKKMLTDAERELTEAVRLSPSSARGQFLLGELAAARQDPQEARARYQRAKELDPEYPAVYERLAKMMEGDGDTNTAGLYLDRATALSPDNLATYASLASFHMRNKQWEKAYKIFDAVRNRFEDSAVFHYNLAVLADKTRRLDESLRETETALKLNSEDPYAALFYFYRLKDSDDRSRQKTLANGFFKKARAFAKDGNHAEAVVQFRKGLMLCPDDPIARYDFALSLRRLGWERSWLRELAVAADLDPENSNWAFQLEKDKRRYNMKMKELGSAEPPRTETRVLVLPFSQPSSAEFHLDAGLLISRELVLHLNNHPRILAVLASGDERTWPEEARRYDMVIRGSFRETPKSIRLDAVLLTARDLQPFQNYSEAFQDNGRAEAAVRNLSRKLIRDIPFSGRVFNIDDRTMLVNLGSSHGIAKTNHLVVYRPQSQADKFRPNKENMLGALKIIELYDEFLVAESADRNLYRTIRLDDSVGPTPRKEPPAPGKKSGKK
jgi:tetratricopeptide (TPR) repeat protein